MCGYRLCSGGWTSLASLFMEEAAAIGQRELTVQSPSDLLADYLEAEERQDLALPKSTRFGCLWSGVIEYAGSFMMEIVSQSNRLPIDLASWLAFQIFLSSRLHYLPVHFTVIQRSLTSLLCQGCYLRNQELVIWVGFACRCRTASAYQVLPTSDSKWHSPICPSILLRSKWRQPHTSLWKQDSL